jgi:hypothetical protein
MNFKRQIDDSIKNMESGFNLIFRTVSNKDIRFVVAFPL